MSGPYVVIGGDAAGMSAAARLKRSAPEAEVIVFERGSHISYSACGMPYWIAGILRSDRQLIIMTPEIARRRRHIDVRIRHDVTTIDRQAKTIGGVNLETAETFTQPYHKLLIATGARAFRPNIPGIDLPGVFSLRSLQDGQAIHKYLSEHTLQRAVLIGGGYIGLEMAEALHARGLEVDIVELEPHVMPGFDAKMVEPVRAHLEEKGVRTHTSTTVSGVQRSDDALMVVTDAKNGLAADIVVLGIGVRPNSELASEAGLSLGPSGAIQIDRHMQTSDPHIYAAGDCVEHHHLVLGRSAYIPLATSANKGGRVAADNLAGHAAEFPGILGTAVVKVFDYTMAITGLCEREAKRSGCFGSDGEFVGATVIENEDRTGYWPGAETLHVELVYDLRDGRVIGCQLVGKAGVNKRIDIVATAITARMTVSDIGLLDLSYAPPYSPTFDPIQICANVAQRSVMAGPYPG